MCVGHLFYIVFQSESQHAFGIVGGAGFGRDR